MGGRLDRIKYLENPVVNSFSEWLESKLDPPGTFIHQYHLVKAGRLWRCSSLYEAYENYWWPYRQYCRIQEKEISSSSFKPTFTYMNCIAKQFRIAVSTNDAATTTKCALEMLKWGGVLKGNRERVIQMGDRSPAYFKRVRGHLDLNSVMLDSSKQIFSNAGFTKLYFLLVNDFIMYDGRVGAALGLLGRLYAEEHNLAKIPSLIEFSFGSGKTSGINMSLSNRRNPSNLRYQLPEFTGRPKRHLNDNIKASWLMKHLADSTKSRFALLPQSPPLDERLTALQSALFMIGYEVHGKVINETPPQVKPVISLGEVEKYPFKTVGRGYRFRVDYDSAREQLRYSYPIKSNGKQRAPDYFGVNEVVEICRYLKHNFAGRPFPLANNVERLYYMTEKPGLGMAIRSLPGADVLKAQASSYVGPYLMNLGVLELVNSHPTMWKLIIDADAVGAVLKKHHL